MNLELNYRIIFRRIGENAMLYDRDTRKSVSLNHTGAQIYEWLMKESDSEKILETFAGDDPEKRHDAERFLAMLQQTECLAGFSGVSAEPATGNFSDPEGRFGIGFSMSGTFEIGDKLELQPCDPAKLRRGDVIRFVDPAGKAVGHRIIGTKDGGWITMGDNNEAPDTRIVTAADDLMLITGITRDGRYYPVHGGTAGMRHFYRLRFCRACRLGFRKSIKKIFLPLTGAFFWRRQPDKVTSFGKRLQYSCRGKLIGWQINGKSVYAKQVLRLFYHLP